MHTLRRKSNLCKSHTSLQLHRRHAMKSFHVRSLYLSWYGKGLSSGLTKASNVYLSRLVSHAIHLFFLLVLRVCNVRRLLHEESPLNSLENLVNESSNLC